MSAIIKATLPRAWPSKRGLHPRPSGGSLKTSSPRGREYGRREKHGWSGEKGPEGFYVGGGFRKLLKDIEDRYNMFAELGLGAIQDFKHFIDRIDSFFDLLADPKTDFRVKLVDYAKVKNDVFEFC